MIEMQGNIWDLGNHQNVVITTNGFVKTNGECVMGRGIAKECKVYFPEIPLKLGNTIKSLGNIPINLGKHTSVRRYPGDFHYIYTFPTKHVWWENSDIELIKRSAHMIMFFKSDLKFYMPRPGCGNGHLNWEDVKPVISPILDDRFVICTF